MTLSRPRDPAHVKHPIGADHPSAVSTVHGSDEAELPRQMAAGASTAGLAFAAAARGRRAAGLTVAVAPLAFALTVVRARALAAIGFAADFVWARGLGIAFGFASDWAVTSAFVSAASSCACFLA